MASFTEYLPKLARCGVGQITIALTEKYKKKFLEEQARQRMEKAKQDQLTADPHAERR